MFELLRLPDPPGAQLDERSPHPHATRALRFAYDALLTPHLRWQMSHWRTILDAFLPDRWLLMLMEVGLLLGAFRMHWRFDLPLLPGK